MQLRHIRHFVAALCVAATALSMSTPVSALRPQVTKVNYTIKLKVTSGTKLTAIVLTAGGRQIASAAITSSPQSLSMTTAKVASIKGATIHLVNSADSSTISSKEGDYFGPVVLSWYGTSQSTSTKVYRRLKASTSTTLDLGSVTVKKVGAGKQGYAISSTKQTEVDTTSSAATKASAAKPVGVGTYGKAASTKVAALGVASDVHSLVTPDFVGDTTLGGDIDDDGIPNAFDVNDDGDSKTDSADAQTPGPKVDVDSEAATNVCAPVDFKIFTNFKATQPGFAGSINNYGTGPFVADSTTIPDRIKQTMSMVFSPITSVCGSAVTKTYLKGIGVPYAPSSYVQLTGTCGTGDYQWAIGKGKMCANPDGSGGTNFGSANYGFTLADLPSGQDTFSMKVETTSGTTYEFTSSAGFVFITHPMLAAFCSGTSATESCTTQSDYTPVDYSSYTTGPDGARVSYSMLLADISYLFLKVYRPQRLSIDGETPGFYDLGGFRWTPDIPNGPGGSQGPGKCDSLTTIDSASDTVSVAEDPKAITLIWNIKSCYVAKNTRWTPGDADFDIQVEPSGPGGNSAQKIRLLFTDGS